MVSPVFNSCIAVLRLIFLKALISKYCWQVVCLVVHYNAQQAVKSARAWACWAAPYVYLLACTENSVTQTS